jgi:heterodisulfide reductase subunit A2
MKVKNATAIIFTDRSNGRARSYDSTELQLYVKQLTGIGAVWNINDLPMGDVGQMAQKIKEQEIERVILAGDSPGYQKAFFSSAMVQAGQDPSNAILADFREYNILSGRDLERAKAVLHCAVRGIRFEQAAIPEESAVQPDTMVIGGGIAGIQAALEIANSNQNVYIVEKSGTIGGHMAMFDKTFPTLDCAACILTPKMVEVGQHPLIKLLTYSEVQQVSGRPGRYTVKILKKARRVNIATCIGCGSCAEKCPATALSEFDAGTTLRKAIYIPFPQAVPNKYLIDEKSCIYLDRGKCGVCVKVCPVPDCINLDEKDEEIEITVGNIIVATGFQIFDAKRTEQFGYGKFPNVLTSLELERLVNAAGPTGGGIHFRSKDKRENWIFSPESDQPKSIALIHCIGSRDHNYHAYCSKVCCMYSLKLAHLIHEKLPDAEVSEYFIDMRAFGKGYEEFYERIREEGVHMIRGRTAKVEQVNGQLLLRSEDILHNRLLEQKVDMVILAVGLEPRADTARLSDMLGIPCSEDGWFLEANAIVDPVSTFSGGISIAGVCQGPKDIPDTVAQASAAASRVLQSIINGSVRGNIKDLTLQTIENKAGLILKMKEGHV